MVCILPFNDFNEFPLPYIYLCRRSILKLPHKNDFIYRKKTSKNRKLIAVPPQLIYGFFVNRISSHLFSNSISSIFLIACILELTFNFLKILVKRYSTDRRLINNSAAISLFVFSATTSLRVSTSFLFRS